MRLSKILLELLSGALVAYVMWRTWLRPEYLEIVRDGSVWPWLVRNSVAIAVPVLAVLTIIFYKVKDHISGRRS